MEKLKDLLPKRILNEDTIMDLEFAEELNKKLQTSIKAAYVTSYVTTLGSKSRPSVMLKISLDAKEYWPNRIYENSRFAIFHIQYDGVIEQVTYLYKLRLSKFRKTRFKTIENVITKINDWVKKSEQIAV